MVKTRTNKVKSVHIFLEHLRKVGVLLSRTLGQELAYPGFIQARVLFQEERKGLRVRRSAAAAGDRRQAIRETNRSRWKDVGGDTQLHPVLAKRIRVELFNNEREALLLQFALFEQLSSLGPCIQQKLGIFSSVQ